MSTIGKIAVALALLLCSAVANSNDTGKFEGSVIAEWLKDGREMRLTQDFAFIDRNKKRWVAKAGAVVDGASIPRVAWTLIGGPFEGQYRESSVIHDVACSEKKETWERVHEVFYEGMIASGVSEARASVMYGAVYHFGPRWERQRLEREIPVEQITERINQYAKLSTDTVAYVAKTQNRRKIQVGGGVLASTGETREVADLIIRATPKPTPFKEQDFVTLQAKIEAGGLSLAEIRAAKP
jgi:hypothetical protein